MKVAVLLSGGVDSSVALHLVKQAGYEDLTAFYLKIWVEDDAAFLGDCPWEDDLNYARAVCDQAGVPLRVVPLQTEYHERIVAHVLDELRYGRTPSPDILCNREIKFGCFLDKIGADFDKIVSGHYARIEERNGEYRLKRAPDRVKDQTYFLYALTQAQLARLWFPLGTWTKDQVRAFAEDIGLPNRGRKDSQGICFLNNIRYADFVRYHLGESPGDIIDRESGRRLGRHRGIWFYTIGQRKGLGLAGGPWYVVGKDKEQSRLYVSHSSHLATHLSHELQVNPVHWINAPPQRSTLQAKIRHTPELEEACVEPIDGARWRVWLGRSDPGIAPGQAAIFYDGEDCLGGGRIE